MIRRVNFTGASKDRTVSAPHPAVRHAGGRPRLRRRARRGDPAAPARGPDLRRGLPQDLPEALCLRDRGAAPDAPGSGPRRAGCGRARALPGEDRRRERPDPRRGRPHQPPAPRGRGRREAVPAARRVCRPGSSIWRARPRREWPSLQLNNGSTTSGRSPGPTRSSRRFVLPGGRPADPDPHRDRRGPQRSRHGPDEWMASGSGTPSASWAAGPSRPRAARTRFVLDKGRWIDDAVEAFCASRRLVDRFVQSGQALERP
jgi:hypothetical protein